MKICLIVAHDRYENAYRIGKKRLCRDPGLNQGPSDLQSDALPTELSRPVLFIEMSGSGTLDMVSIQ